MITMMMLRSFCASSLAQAVADSSRRAPSCPHASLTQDFWVAERTCQQSEAFQAVQKF